MRWRDLAVVGLAGTSCGRELRPRQLAPYGANSTETTSTAFESTTSSVTLSQPPAASSYGGEQLDPSSLVAAPPAFSYDAQTTTASVYPSDSSIASAGSPPTYSSQIYSFAPPQGSGTAPSQYSPPPPGPTSPPVYGPTGTGSVQQPAPNATCSGATLNVLEASLDWWYTRTLYYAVSTFSVQFDSNDSATGWTLVPATTPFDVESALAEPDCTSTQTWVASVNASLVDVDCTPAASPVAAETTIITQTAYEDPPSTTGTGALPDVVITPPPASISVPDATQAPYAEGTPFVFFSQYEIVTKSVTTHSNGSEGCAEVTQAYAMDDAFSFEYTGADVNGSLLVGAGVTGDVNPALLGLVGQDTAVAGSWVAEPTVVLLMQEVLAAEAALAATTEPTATSLETPTPTRPPIVTLAPTGPGGPPKITASPRVESSQTALQLPTRPGDDNRPTDAGPAEQTQGGGGSPQDTDDDDEGGRPIVVFIAHVAQSDITLQLPADPTQTVVTAAFEGQTVTATRLSAVQGTQGPENVEIGGLVDAVNSVARLRPTNAFDVLSQAEATFPGSNPTANAILNGIGGSSAAEDNLPGGADGGQSGGSGSGGGSRAITVGGAVITPNAQNEYRFASGATLTPGGVAVVDGTTISLDSAASAVVVNGVTQPLASPAEATDGPDVPLITVGSAAITPNAATEYSIAPGATLTPGGSIVVDGTTISLDSAATALIINGQTGTLASPADATDASGAEVTKAPILTIAGQTFRAINGGTTYVIDGETLTVGEEETVTIDGTAYEISLSPWATRLIVETQDADGRVTATSTQTLFPEQGSGSGSGATATASGSGDGGPEQQVGNAASVITTGALPWSGMGFAVGSLVLAVWL